MKKQFSVLAVSLVVVGLVFSLVGTAAVSEIALAKNVQGADNQATRPVSPAGIQIVKKAFLPQDFRGVKGKPSSPPGQDKDDYEWTATGVLGESLAEGASKYAVIIGICDYPGSANDLCVSDGDSLHMYKALTELYEYEPENIRLFKDGGGTTGFVNLTTGEKITAEIPTRSNILDAIESLNPSSDDEVVFFFSGHGARGEVEDIGNEDIDEAIVVHDSDGDVDEDGSSELDFIWDEELRMLFSGFQTSRITFIFDTCLAGGMNDVAANGRVVAMATGETQSAYVYSTAGEDVDGDEVKDGEGVFSHFFVNEGMLQNMADGYNQIQKLDDNVAVEESFDYAKDNIPPYLKRRQKPVISDNFENDLLLGYYSGH